MPATAPLFNPFLPEYVADPRPFLHRLRDEERVHWSPSIGVWVVTGYAEVMEALHDERLSAASRHWDKYRQFFVRDGVASDPPTRVYDNWLLQLDPPDHTRLRALLNQAFTPRASERMAPLIHRVTRDLLDRVCAAGRMDVVADLAYPLPMIVIAEMLGVPREDHDRIKDWCVALLPSFSPAMSVKAARAVAGALAEFRAYFRELAGQRRRKPQDDLLTALVNAHDHGDRLNEDELIATAIFLAFAGHASTVQLLAAGVRIFMEHPEARDALFRDDPSTMPAWVEEVCRYVSPLQLAYRTTREEVELGGVTIPKGQMVFLSTMGANFDPAQFPDPDRFDPARRPNRHVAFGHGIHYCAGAPLARLEAKIVIPAVFERLQNLELSGPLRREPSVLFRGITHMPVRFDPREPA